jgi:hypothetical protein
MAHPNAQNSELDPEKHPSGARIEKMISGEKTTSNTKSNAKSNSNANANSSDKGLYGETLRPSERDDDDTYIPTRDQAEGEREDVHRRTPSTREQ